jgi:tetratricopeptide (TPR) repeat protein
MVRLFWLYFLAFLFVLLGLSNCSFAPNELKMAEQLIETAPDSALNILKHVSPNVYKSDANRALYGLLMIQALDKKLLPLKPDSLLDFSIAYYQEHPDNDRLAKCYLYKGRSYKYVLQYEAAMNFYLKAIDALNPNENFLLQARIHSDMGDICVYQRDYELARQKYKSSYRLFKKARRYDSAAYSLIDIGKTYYFTNDYKNAQKYFHTLLVSSRDSFIVGVVLHEIGYCYNKSGQVDSALVYYKKSVTYPYIGCNRAVRYYYLANLYFDLNKTDSAFKCAQLACRYQPDIRTERECYRIMTNCEFKKGHMESMSLYMNKYVHLGDSLRKIDAQTKGSYIETMHSTRQEVEKKQSWLWYMGVILLVAVAVFVFAYVVKHRKGIQKLQLSEENGQIQRADIRKEVMLKHRDALLRKIEDRKSLHTEEWKKASPAKRERIDRKMYDELLHLNDIEFFYKEMDTVLNNMVTKLQTRYQLNQKEIEWCCLYLLNVSGQDMMMLLDYSPDALKKMRQRLAKTKFGIASLRELEPFLFAILTE